MAIPLCSLWSRGNLGISRGAREVCHGNMRMSGESVITSWLCQSSERRDQGGVRIDTPLFEGVLNLCFLLSHVCSVTSEWLGKTATPSNLFWKNQCCLVFRRKLRTLFQKISELHIRRMSAAFCQKWAACGRERTRLSWELFVVTSYMLSILTVVNYFPRHTLHIYAYIHIDMHKFVDFSKNTGVIVRSAIGFF